MPLDPPEQGAHPKDNRSHIAPILAQFSGATKLLGLIVLISELILPVAMYQTPDTDSVKHYYPFAVFTLLAFIVAFAFYDLHLQRSCPPKPPPEQEAPRAVRGAFPQPVDEALADTLNDISTSLNKALNVRNDFFRYAMQLRLDRFAAEAEDWGKQELYIGPDQSKEYLINLYESARNNIFSTSVKDFFSSWSDQFGKKILQANIQRSPQIRITRVFIFHKREDVTEEDLNQITFQNEHGIEVRIYFDDEEEDSFTSSRDFTIIDDGKVIGLTESFGEQNNSARYYFDSTKKRLFLPLRDSLLKHSESYSDFVKWWKRSAQVE